MLDDIRSLVKHAKETEPLTAETEFNLARAWREQRDETALHRLVEAYLRLAISVANKYRRYGAPMSDLTQVAVVGLMIAASKFDPERGVRFSTYAIWWIKAATQDFVMYHRFQVRTGTTSSQKALFFNLRRVHARIEAKLLQADGVSTADDVRRGVAEELGVPLRDVEMMEARLSGSDFSLNTPLSDGDGREWIDTLVDPTSGAEEVVACNLDLEAARGWLATALERLTDRERMIIMARKYSDTPETLESLGAKLGLSKERVRQIEAEALEKMRAHLEPLHGVALRGLLEA